MTAAVVTARAGARAGGPAPPGRWGRLAALVGLELRRQWRYGVVGLFAILTLAWVGLLLVLPAPVTSLVAGWLLMFDTAVFGATVAGALLLLDRSHGMLAALAATPARLGEFLTARVAVLAGLVLGSAVPLALAGRLPVAGALVGAGLTGVLTTLLAAGLAVRCRSVISLLAGLPLVLLPLLLPVLAVEAGFGYPWLFLSPTTGAMQLVRGDLSVPGSVAAVAWLVLSCAAAAMVARRGLRRYAMTGPPAGGGRARRLVPLRAPSPERAAGPVRAFLRGDLVRVGRDPVLLLIAASPVLLGLALRFGYPPTAEWLADAHGFDLAPYRPLLLAVAVVLHVPVTFGMVGALLVLDEVDDRALLALRTSPLTLPGYLRYRSALVGVTALLGLVAAVPLSGLVSLGQARLWPALLVAALLAPLTMLATLAVARNKVAGVAVLKLLGLPLYAPLASWWLPSAGWPLAVLPSWWTVQALWSDWPYALGGAVASAALLLLLARRALTRLSATAG